MRKCLIGMVLLAGGLASLIGCAISKPSDAPIASPSASKPVAKEPNTVVIDNFSFNPQVLTVAAGTRVHWVNRDDVPHTVKSAGEPVVIDSPVMDTDGRYEMTFQVAGSYPYYCTVHPHMTGTIVVK